MHFLDKPKHILLQSVGMGFEFGGSKQMLYLFSTVFVVLFKFSTLIIIYSTPCTPACYVPGETVSIKTFKTKN